MPEPLFSLFNFEVVIAPSGFGGDAGLARAASFAEVSGLEITLEQREVREGGYNSGVRHLVGKVSHPEIVLKRGLTRDAAFWTWVERCFSGQFPLPYVDGEIRMHASDPSGPPAVWRFRGAIATRVRVSDLNAASASGVPIEELHLSHEQLLYGGAGE